jgi:hypothetical protein
MQEIGLSEADQQQIFAGNISELLGLVQAA